MIGRSVPAQSRRRTDREEVLLRSGPIQPNLTQELLRALNARPRDRLDDISGGPNLRPRQECLRDHRHSVVCADPAQQRQNELIAYWLASIRRYAPLA